MGYEVSLSTSPSDDPRVIVPSDDGADDFTERLPREIYCGSDGDLVVVRRDGAEVTYPVVKGVTLSISPVRIKATGTTVSPVIGHW